MYEDKTLICKDCHKEFVFTAGEQEFYAEKGFVNEPQRCKACRQAKRQFAMIAAESQEFLSSPARTSLFIAALALRRERTTHKDILI